MQPLKQAGQRHLVNQIVRFSQSLRSAGVTVSPAKLIDLGRCMTFIDISKRLDFYAAARTTLVSRQADIPAFDQVFKEFWSPPGEQADEAPDGPAESVQGSAQGEAHGLEQRKSAWPEEDRQAGPAEHEDSPPRYSPDEVLLKKDFALMSDRELEQARRLVAALIAIMANFSSRRRQPSAKGIELDFRKMLGRNVFYARDGIELWYRKRKIKKVKLMLLCDISGSMEPYSRFLIQFMYAMRQQLASLDVAVFATRMTVITSYLARHSVERSLSDIAANVHDWGGGTDIGKSLWEFNYQFGREAAHANTVVIILSDGWDCGDAALMAGEMNRLHRSVHKLIWLNPLLGDSEYQPLCQGVQAALPYIDHFLPAHNLESFASLIRVLRTAWR